MRKKINWTGWEKIDEETSRLAVFGGWLMKFEFKKGTHIVKVDDKDHDWQVVHPQPEVKNEFQAPESKF
jgi:hypothetical protein